jgi:hypothetical protein
VRSVDENHLGFGGEIKEKNVRSNIFDWVRVALNRFCPFIYIRWGGLPREKSKTHPKPT